MEIMNRQRCPRLFLSALVIMFRVKSNHPTANIAKKAMKDFVPSAILSFVMG
jgi:hypothetical protein